MGASIHAWDKRGYPFGRRVAARVLAASRGTSAPPPFLVPHRHHDDADALPEAKEADRTQRTFPNLYASPSILITGRSTTAPALIRAIGADRLLVESDIDDVQYATRLVWGAVEWVARVKGWRLEDGTEGERRTGQAPAMDLMGVMGMSLVGLLRGAKARSGPCGGWSRIGRGSCGCRDEWTAGRIHLQRGAMYDLK